MNNYLFKKCQENNFVFFDIYSYYEDDAGLLNWDMSDKIYHIEDNNYICDEIEKILI